MSPDYPSSAVVDVSAVPAATLNSVGNKPKDETPRIPSRIPVLPAVTGRDGNKTICTLYRAYELHPDIVKGLASLADKGCYKCKETGISRWRGGGLRAQVCACVLAKQDRAEEFLKTVDPTVDPAEVA